MSAINWIGRLLGWLLLTAFQVLVLTQLDLGALLHPYVFPMFAMLLPFSVPRWLVLVLAFIAGLVVDMFNNTPGMHAAAMVVIAYLRPAILKMLTPVSGYEGIEYPSFMRLGFIWFLLYCLSMAGVHHLVYFQLETLSWTNFPYTLLKSALSLLVSVFLMINFAFIFSSRKSAERK